MTEDSEINGWGGGIREDSYYRFTYNTLMKREDFFE